MQPSSGTDGSSEAMSQEHRRSVGAAYLHAYVSRDIDELKRLQEQYPPEVLLAGLATASRAMVIHISEVEHTSPDVVTGAYRDVWSHDADPDDFDDIPGI